MRGKHWPVLMLHPRRRVLTVQFGVGVTADWTATVTARGQRLSREHLFLLYQTVGMHQPMKSAKRVLWVFKGSSQSSSVFGRGKYKRYPASILFSENKSPRLCLRVCVGAFVCPSWKLGLCCLAHRLLTMLH